MDTKDFGDRMRNYRKEHKLTQRELAELMDISTNHVSVLERSQKLPRATTIEAFERLLSKDEAKQYAGEKKLSEKEIDEIAALIRCINRLSDHKKREASRAITRLIELM